MKLYVVEAQGCSGEWKIASDAWGEVLVFRTESEAIAWAEKIDIQVSAGCLRVTFYAEQGTVYTNAEESE
jgi:hypothetical protein